MFRLGWIAAASTLVLAACGASATHSARPRGDCPTAPVPVVVSVDQWGDIVDQLAGDCGDVTTIFKSSSADPHDYEPTPADTAEFSGAKLVVVNGLDYDPWADKAVATLDDEAGGRERRRGRRPRRRRQPAHLVRARLRVRRSPTRSPPSSSSSQPKAATYFEQRGTRRGERRWRPTTPRSPRSSRRAAGKTYGATEGIFDYMADGARPRRTRRRRATRRATANESDPAPGDVHDFEQALADGKMTVLIFNTQTQGAIPEQIRDARPTGAASRSSTSPRACRRVRVASWPGRSSQLRRPRRRRSARDATRSTLDGVSAARGGSLDLVARARSRSRPDAIVGVIGPNGSGKTTLLEMLLGLLPLAAGQLTVLGERPARGQPAHRLRAAELHRRGRRGDPLPRPRRSAAPARVGVSDGGPATTAPPSTPPSPPSRPLDVATAASRSSRAASSSGSRSPRRSSATPSCSCSTSRSPTSTSATSTRSSSCSATLHAERGVTILVVVHDLNPLLSILSGADLPPRRPRALRRDRRRRRQRAAHPPLRHARSRSCAPRRATSSPGADAVIHLLADVGYQSNWFDVLQADFMRNAFVGGTLVAIASGLIGYFVVIRRDAFAAHALAPHRLPGRDLRRARRHPGHARARALLRDRRPRDRRTRQAGREPRGLDRHDPRRSPPGSGCCSPRSRPRTPARSRASCSATCSRSRTAQIRTFTAVHRRARRSCSPSSPARCSSRRSTRRSPRPRACRSGALGIAFMVLLALAITMAVQVVGTLLLFALVVTPGRRRARDHRPAGRRRRARHRRSASPSVWLGLVLAVMFNLPPSFCIVTLAFLAWITTLVVTAPPVASAHGASAVDHAHDRHHVEPADLSL